MIPEEIRPQLDTVVDELKRIVGPDLVGVYLHGSAVLGAFGPHSDIDLVAVSRQPVGRNAKQRLLDLLLSVSGGYKDTGPLRPVELDLVEASTLEHWRHPAPFVFHYSESLRPRFEAGELEPWDEEGNRDLAAHVAVVREAGIALVGPPAPELFPAVPDADFRDALLYDVEWWREHLAELETIPGGVRNAVLSLARIWATLGTATSQSKPSGATWALPHLPSRLRPVLEHAAALHAGDEGTEHWEELPVADYVATVAAEIDRF